MIKFKEYSLEEFVKYLTPQMKYRKLQGVMLHHTYSPTRYVGLSTIEAVQRYHMSPPINAKAILANAYVVGANKIVNGRPLSYDNYAHAAIVKANLSQRIKNISKGDSLFFNKFTFGIETLGNFDETDPKKSETMSTALDLAAQILKMYNLPPDRLFFHNEVSPKSCPGKRVDLGWATEEVRKRMYGIVQEEDKSDMSKILIVDRDSEEVYTRNAIIVDGVLYAPVREYTDNLIKGKNEFENREECDGPTEVAFYPQHLKTQGKVYTSFLQKS